MKLSAILWLCIFMGYWAKADDDQPLKTNISHVTVFLNRAQITSLTKTTVNAGLTNLILSGIPADVDKQSIQVSGKAIGGGEIVIMAVKQNVNYLANQTKTPQLIRLEDSLQLTRNDLNSFVYLKDVLNKEQQMILANQSIRGEQTGVTVEKLQAMADFFRTRLSDINARLIKNDQQIGKTTERVNRLQQQLNELNAQRNQPVGEVVVTVSAKSRVAVELELNYLVNNAGWSPVYDLRAKNTKSPIQLSYKAYVYQNTGINWDHVKLTLSTTNPSLGGTQPTLNPQYVDLYRPESLKGKIRIRGLASAQEDAKSESEDSVQSAPVVVGYGTEKKIDVQAQSVADYTTVTETTLSVNFDISLPYSIASGGNPQLVDVTSHELPATYRHIAVPKLDSDAFLLARVSGWEQYNLLSGNANIYFEGTFVGESFLDANNTGDTLSFSLGRDKKVVVKREKTTDFSSRKTIGAHVKEMVSYRITVRNTKNESVQLTLEDQFPVSKDSQIEVELVEANGAEQNKETGKLTWQLNLKPAQTLVLELKYNVKYPKGKSITNLY